MYLSNIDVQNLSYTDMTKLLFSNIEDDKQNGDCIFVAGSSKATKYRLPQAIKLYKQGRANKILFSGGVKWNENDHPEAINLKKHAIHSGIPENDILVEDQSLHTLENVLASLLVLDRAFKLYKINRLLVVTSAFHMKRLYLTLKTYMPHWIQFTLCPAEDDSTTKDNWFLSQHGRKRVKEECAKLIQYVKQGGLKDIEVDL